MKPSKYEVLPTSEARTELSAAVLRFRSHGLLSKPILFGGHRKAEAAIISIELYERLLPEIENIQFNETLLARINDGKERISFEELVANVGFDLKDLEDTD